MYEEKTETVLYYLYEKAASEILLVIHSPDSQYPFILLFVPLLLQNQYIGNFDPSWALP